MTGRPRTRIVLLGASNLVRMLPRGIARVRASLGSPVEIHCAHGRGRSYCGPSRFLGRELCGIGESRIWEALGSPGENRTLALLTDVGNDILYGASVDAIARAVERALDRLQAAGARTVVARLPLASLEHLPRWRFHAVHRVFFPTRRVEFEDARRRAFEVDARLTAFAKARGMEILTPPAAWYGLDPIHVAYSQRDAAWRSILSAWGLEPGNGRARRLPARDRLRLLRARRDRPSAVLLDGTTIALY